MSSTSPGWQITPRDRDLLASLTLAPFTARQLHKLSQTWSEAFPSAKLVRERMQRLAAAKLIKAHRYAVLRAGQPENYYVLSHDGYELVHGPDNNPPTKALLSPVGLGRQPHQQALSEFIVHTAWGAHQSDLSLAGFYRENAIRLDAGGRTVYPDCSFLLTRGREHFRFFAEIDNGTERVRSQKDTESIERKIRTYDAFQDLRPGHRFRVLFVSAQNSRERLSHLLDLAAQVIGDPNRTLFYGITLANYLTTHHPVTSPRFLDHRGDRQSLVPDLTHFSPALANPLRTARATC